MLILGPHILTIIIFGEGTERGVAVDRMEATGTVLKMPDLVQFVAVAHISVNHALSGRGFLVAELLIAIRAPICGETLGHHVRLDELLVGKD